MLPEPRPRSLFRRLNYSKCCQAWLWAAVLFGGAVFTWWYVTEEMENARANARVNWILLLTYLVAGKVGCVMLFVIPGALSALYGVYLWFFPAPAQPTSTPTLSAQGQTEVGEPLGAWRVRDPDTAVAMRPGRKGPVAILVAGLLLGGFSIWEVYHEAASGVWFFVFLAGLLVVIGLAMLFSRRLHLYLTEEGFEGGGLFRRFGYRWSEVGAFAVLEERSVRRVAFQIASVFGDEEADELTERLCDNYGMSAEALAALMNSWRSRYLDAAQQPGAYAERR
jgi:hypothetical protein